jgi:hypothetical protein
MQIVNTGVVANYVCIKAMAGKTQQEMKSEYYTPYRPMVPARTEVKA